MGMRKDFQIALLCAVSAVPLGIAMSVAPDYISALKTHAALSFWGGILITAILLLVAAILAIRGERLAESAPGAKKRMIPFIVMIVLCIAILAGVAWRFWPIREKIVPPSQEATNACGSISQGAPKWLQIAAKECGQKELEWPQENPRIQEYFAALKDGVRHRQDIETQSEDWASPFVEWALNQAGIEGPQKIDPLGSGLID